MLDSMLRTLRKPRIRNRVVPLLRRFGLLGVAFRRYEIVRARQAAESDTTTWPDHDNGLPLPPARRIRIISS